MFFIYTVFYSILHVDNKLVTKKCFCFCACRKSNKQFNLVTVQCQIVKPIIHGKNNNFSSPLNIISDTEKYKS